MLPRNKRSTKFLLWLSVILILLLALIAIFFLPVGAQNDSDIVFVSFDGGADDAVRTYTVSGNISPADVVEIRFEFAGGIHIYPFATSENTVQLQSTVTGHGALVGVTARAQSQGVWRDINVILMSFAATVEAPPTVATFVPTSTITPTQLPTNTPTPRATLQPLPMNTPTPAATAPVKGCHQSIAGCNVYLPFAAK